MANSKQSVVAFLTLSSDSSVKEFANDIEKELPEHTCKYVQLSVDDLRSCHTQRSEGYCAIVLLHSVQEGRNAVTDVPDGKYSFLLPDLTYKYGADRVAVVVYSMPSLQKPCNKDAMMLAFERSQPTTFLCSKCVIQCNNLHTMDMDYRCKLNTFLKEASNSTLPESREETVDISTERNAGNNVALRIHSGPDISLELSNNLKTEYPHITFETLVERSVNSIHLFKAVLVLVENKYLETDCMFAYLTTSCIYKNEPNRKLGFLIMEKTDESVSFRDYNNLPRIPLFVYSRKDEKYFFKKSTLTDMEKWFTDDCRLLQHTCSCSLCTNSLLWRTVDWFFT